MRLWLVRHAETDWTGRRWSGTNDPPLNDLGLDAAAELAARLAPRLEPPLELWCSPQSRARQTAAPLGSALGLEPRVAPTLHEIDFGRIEGLAWDGIEQEHPTIASQLLRGDVAIDWPDGETWAATSARARSTWADIESAATETLVLVSHGGFFRALLTAVGLPSELLSPASGIALERDCGWKLTGDRER